MRKPAFLSNERLSRFLVSILLTMGLLLPLMFTFEAESALALAIASATAVTVLCTALGTLRRGRLVLGIVGYYAAVQFVWLNFATHAQYWVPYQFMPLGWLS